MSAKYIHFSISVVDYNIVNELALLMKYFERFWMDTVTPQKFTVYQLEHRTNNLIETYHASILRLMGQHQRLDIFYGNH